MVRLLIFLTSMAVMIASAAAEPTVLAIQGDEIFVELGARDGVGAGSELELLHEVVAKDPRTGAVLRDRFSLGTLTVVKSGDRLSVAAAPPELAKRVLVGDRVKLVSGKRTFVDPWQAQIERSKNGTPPGAPGATAPDGGAPTTLSVDHVSRATDAWRDTLGQPPERRIQRWTELLTADPRTPYRKLVENEIVSLRKQAQDRDAALARARSVRTDDLNPRIAALAAELERTQVQPRVGGDVLVAAPLSRAVPNRAIDMSFLVRQPALVGRAWLYARPEGEPGYHRIELVRDGDSYLRGTIEAAAVKTGRLDWYVEAQGPGANHPVAPVIGAPGEPERIVIDAVAEEPPIASGRSHIDAHVDYVDFDGKLGTGWDQYTQAEFDFTYRFLTPVHAVRLGFGTLSGKGGPKDVIDEDPSGRCVTSDGAFSCRQVTFSYVYTELELRLRPNIALMIRPQAGLLTTDSQEDSSGDRCMTADTANCASETGFGGRARVRFGNEWATNLVLGFGFTDGVGTLVEAAYNWLPHHVVPVQLTVQVTDMPVPEDFGVRLIADVGLRRLSWFYPSVRVSYQARDIDHAGVSGGLAMNFDW